MAIANNTGLRRIINATFFSIAGLKAAWDNEAAFRQECVLAVAMVPIAFWLGRNAVERALLIAPCLLVLIVELLNSAVESIVDRVGTEHHSLSGRAKDQGSAAVLVSLVLTVLVWGLIAWDRFA
jgi:diacylglycerol kinase (ATP)